jgi:chromosome segregation ATPase
MSDTNQISDILGNREPKTELRHSSALDRALPPLWMLGGLIGLVCLLLLAMGWKIMAFEAERADQQMAMAEESKNLALGKQELEHQLQQLAEQKKRHQEILAQLPQLEEQRTSLAQKVAVLQSENEALEIRLKTASEQMEAIREQAKTAQRNMNDAIERRDSAQNEFKTLSAQSSKLQPQVEALSRKEHALGEHIAMLQEQQNTLERDTVKLRQTHDELEIKVSSLNSQIAGKTQALEALQQDGQAYESLSQGFQEVLANFQTLSRDAGQTVNGLKTEAEAFTGLMDIRNKAERASEGLHAEAENARKTVGNLEQERKLLQAATTDLHQRLDEFTKQAERLQGVADRTGQGVSKLDSSAAKLEQEYQILQKFNQNLSTQVDQWSRSLNQTLKDGKLLAEQILQLESATAAAVQLGDKSGRLDALLNDLASLKEQLNSMARKLEHLTNTSSDLLDPTFEPGKQPASKNTSQPQ